MLFEWTDDRFTVSIDACYTGGPTAPFTAMFAQAYPGSTSRAHGVSQSFEILHYFQQVSIKSITFFCSDGEQHILVRSKVTSPENTSNKSPTCGTLLVIAVPSTKDT